MCLRCVLAADGPVRQFERLRAAEPRGGAGGGGHEAPDRVVVVPVDLVAVGDGERRLQPDQDVVRVRHDVRRAPACGLRAHRRHRRRRRHQRQRQNTPGTNNT